MIRFLQKENRLTKALFVVIIAAASVSMVVYLIPGLTGQSASGADTFAVVYPHWYSRFLSAGDVISQQKVTQMATQRVQQQYPQYAGNPMIMNMIEPQVGQQLVQQQILLEEATNLGVRSPMPICATICRPVLRGRCCSRAESSSARTSTPR
jgi:peptidyl-prolyl cis-trans isomerase D